MLVWQQTGRVSLLPADIRGIIEVLLLRTPPKRPPFMLTNDGHVVNLSVTRGMFRCAICFYAAPLWGWGHDDTYEELYDERNDVFTLRYDSARETPYWMCNWCAGIKCYYAADRVQSQ